MARADKKAVAAAPTPRGAHLLLALLVTAVTLSGMGFAVFAARTGDQVAILGRRLPASVFGLFVAYWGLLYALRLVRMVRRERRQRRR